MLKVTTICAVLLLAACGSKDKESDHPAAVKTWTPGVSQNLSRNPGTTSAVIDNIGTVGNPASQKIVEVSGAQTFGITGWAVDEPNKSAASGVDAVIDQAPYSAHYGSPRPDVASHFNQPAYQNSGYELMVAPGQLAKGPHSVSIRVISSDKKTYYQGPMVQFSVN